jgi:hypothetical protein
MLQSLLTVAESRFGNLSALLAPPSPAFVPVLTVDKMFTSEHLSALARHEHCAIHVKGFIDHKTCERHAEILANKEVSKANKRAYI